MNTATLVRRIETALPNTPGSAAGFGHCLPFAHAAATVLAARIIRAHFAPAPYLDTQRR